MVHHFVNLVCWEDVFEDLKADRDKIYLDSISIYILAKFFKVGGNYFPGTKMASILKKRGPESMYFLLASDLIGVDCGGKMILPRRDSFDGEEAVKQFIHGLPAGVTVIVGISSPKQNKLAIFLSTIRPDLEIFCLGAALEMIMLQDSRGGFLSGSGFQWLSFFLLKPVRTFDKVVVTLKSAILILGRKSVRLRFKAFLRSALEGAA